MSRRAGAALAVAIVTCLVAAAFALRGAADSDAAALRRLPTVLRHLHTISLSQRSSLRDAEGVFHYTDSSAILDLEHDEAFVSLPSVLHNGQLELVSQGLSLYVTVPKDQLPAFGGVRWLRVDTDSRARARGAGFGPVPDPATVLLSLTGATGKVRRLGTRVLDGEKLRVEHVAVQPKEMARHIGRDDVASANALGGISLHWTADVWLDQRGRPRRIQLATPVRQQGQPAGTVLFDLRLGAFDDPVTVGIPPPDAVRTVPSLAEALRLVGVT